MAKKQARRSERAILIVVLTILCLSQNSYSAESTFQTFLLSYIFPSESIYFSSLANFRCSLKINGATAYHHIVFFGDTTGKSKTDATLYKPDVYDFPSQLGNDLVRHYAYITQAPGLVKIQMSIFSNSIKATQQFYIAAQFDRGYTFMGFYSNVACKVKLTAGGPYASYSYNLFSSKADAFSTSLQQLTFGSSTFTLPSPGKHYIRIIYNTSADLQNTSFFGVDVVTFSQNPCQNQCPYGGSYNSLNQIGGGICSCSSPGQFFDVDTRQCRVCDSSSTSTLCRQMRAEICGNGIKQGPEQCDVDSSTGCTNCTIDAGYVCTENQFNQSACSQPTVPPTNEQKVEEAGLSIEARNRIIIGVCVGVGGGIIVGIAIFFIVKYLKAKAALSQTANMSQDMKLEGKKQSDSVAVIL